MMRSSIGLSQLVNQTAFVLMLLSIFVGTIIDDLGMKVESCWLDRQREAKTKGLHFAEWWAYLRKPFEIEPSGGGISEVLSLGSSLNWECRWRWRLLSRAYGSIAQPATDTPLA